MHGLHSAIFRYLKKVNVLIWGKACPLFGQMLIQNEAVNCEFIGKQDKSLHVLYTRNISVFHFKEVFKTSLQPEYFVKGKFERRKHKIFCKLCFILLHVKRTWLKYVSSVTCSRFWYSSLMHSQHQFFPSWIQVFSKHPNIWYSI